MIKEYLDHFERPSRVLLKNGGVIEGLITGEKNGQLKMVHPDSAGRISSLDTSYVGGISSEPLIVIPRAYNYRPKK